MTATNMCSNFGGFKSSTPFSEGNRKASVVGETAMKGIVRGDLFAQ